MKINPVKNNLLIRLKNLEDDSPIIIPETATQITPSYGEIVAIGPDCKTPLDSKILFRFDNIIMSFGKGEDEVFLVSESCVIATCNPELNQDGTEIPNN